MNTANCDRTSANYKLFSVFKFFEGNVLNTRVMYKMRFPYV